MFMADGRFAKDETWFFYALNCAERRRNTTQGQWFVNKLLHSEEKPCIETTQHSFISNSTLPSVYQAWIPIGETKELS
jgi:hypothetical protein